MTTAPAVDAAKADALAERLLEAINGGMAVLNIYVGDRLGLFKALAEHGPSTSEQLAQHTGYNERYVREWLHGMASGEYIDHDDGTFSLSPEQQALFADDGHPAYAAPFAHWIPSLAGPLEELMEAFKTGGGVAYELYGQAALTAIGAGNRPMFMHDYVASWIPALPDVETKLKGGARVADIGCGVGWSSIALAKGYPNVTIDALDSDEESVRQAKENAQAEGVADRITFHLATAEEAELAGPYDLVTAFECLHDMAYPVRALARMRELAGADGTVLIADEAANDTLEENTNFLGHFFYNFSILHCLPQAMVFPDAAGTGTAMRPATLREYANEAGFSRVDIIDEIENPFWRFYRLTP